MNNRSNTSNTNNSINVSDLISSPYLKASDLEPGKPYYVTIKGADRKVFREQGEKIVVSFFDDWKPLVCNTTQLRALASLFGDETAGWINQRILLMAVPSSFQNRPTIAIQAAPPTIPTARAHGYVQPGQE